MTDTPDSPRAPMVDDLHRCLPELIDTQLRVAHEWHNLSRAGIRAGQSTFGNWSSASDHATTGLMTNSDARSFAFRFGRGARPPSGHSPYAQQGSSRIAQCTSRYRTINTRGEYAMNDDEQRWGELRDLIADELHRSIDEVLYGAPLAAALVAVDDRAEGTN